MHLLKLGDLEATNQTNDLFLALKQGHDTLQRLQQEVTLADVEQLMNNNAEAKAVQVPRCSLILFVFREASSSMLQSNLHSEMLSIWHMLQDEMHQMLGMTLTSDEKEAVAAELSEMQALSAIDLMPNVPGVSCMPVTTYAVPVIDKSKDMMIALCSTICRTALSTKQHIVLKGPLKNWLKIQLHCDMVLRL